MINKLLLCITMTLFLTCSIANGNDAMEDQYLVVKIYYYGWDVLTRSKLSIEDVRKNSKISIIITDGLEIKKFIRWAKFDELKLAENKAIPDDPRMVIDLHKKNEILTYYASKFALYSFDSKLKKRIDKAFRDKFGFDTD